MWWLINFFYYKITFLSIGQAILTMQLYIYIKITFVVLFLYYIISFCVETRGVSVIFFGVIITRYDKKNNALLKFKNVFLFLQIRSISNVFYQKKVRYCKKEKRTQMRSCVMRSFRIQIRDFAAFFCVIVVKIFFS